MTKRKRLGQHFLNSARIARDIVYNAEISRDDTVYEVGTGLGVLTPLLCENSKQVISIDADNRLFESAQSKFSHIKNLTLQFGDGFKTNNKFSVFVSNLPYSKSRFAIEWLAQTPFSHGAITVQREFAQKLLPGSASERRAVGIIANHTLEITRISNISRDNFDPAPSVDSVLLKIRKKANAEKTLVQTINRIFSYRRKTIRNILKQFGRDTITDRRLDDLTNEEIVDLAKEIAKK